MPDTTNAAQLLGSILGFGSRYASTRLFSNDIHPDARTTLADLEPLDVNPLQLAPKIQFAGPQQSSDGLALTVSLAVDFTRTAASALKAKAYGFGLTVNVPILNREVLLVARRFAQAIVLPKIGSTVGLQLSIAAIKNPNPTVQELLLDVGHRIIHARAGVHKTLRAQLKRLQDVLRRVLSRQASGLERADTMGSPYQPFVPDEITDQAAQTVLSRCSDLLGS